MESLSKPAWPSDSLASSVMGLVQWKPQSDDLLKLTAGGVAKMQSLNRLRPEICTSGPRLKSVARAGAPIKAARARHRSARLADWARPLASSSNLSFIAFLSF